MSILYISEWRHRFIRTLSRDGARRFWLAVTFAQILWTFNGAAARSPGHSYLHCPAYSRLQRLSVRRQSNLRDARFWLRSGSRSDTGSLPLFSLSLTTEQSRSLDIRCKSITRHILSPYYKIKNIQKFQQIFNHNLHLTDTFFFLLPFRINIREILYIEDVITFIS